MRKDLLLKFLSFLTKKRQVNEKGCYSKVEIYKNKKLAFAGQNLIHRCSQLMELYNEINVRVLLSAGNDFLQHARSLRKEQ